MGRGGFQTGSLRPHAAKGGAPVTRALRRRPPPVVARQAVRAPAPSITEQASEEQQKRRLEDSFRLDGAASPELPAPQAGGVSSSAARDATSQARAPAAADAAAWPPAALRLPRWLVEAERRLEADLPTIGLTVLFMVALIGYERGVQSLLDNVFGDSPKGSVACIIMGLWLVFGVKLSGVRWTAVWDVSAGSNRGSRRQQ